MKYIPGALCGALIGLLVSNTWVAAAIGAFYFVGLLMILEKQ